ncbi:MAG: hypothetical protein K8T20_01000 [Planctomycetes bacterium]|nr:hypothetical protein [Planctomycetota bacterium]
MRICTQCGHKLSAEEYLCPACELWDTRSYKEPRTARRVRPMATIFEGPFQHALLVRKICEGMGIPAVIDAERGASFKGEAIARVQVPQDRARDAVEILTRQAGESLETGTPLGPGLRRKRSHLRARLSLRRRAYQALAWAMVALVFPPAAAVAVKLGRDVLSENRGLPVVTEETRVARASLAISAVSIVLFVVVIGLLLHGVRPVAK